MKVPLTSFPNKIFPLSVLTSTHKTFPVFSLHCTFSTVCPYHYLGYVCRVDHSSLLYHFIEFNNKWTWQDSDAFRSRKMQWKQMTELNESFWTNVNTGGINNCSKQKFNYVALLIPYTWNALITYLVQPRPSLPPCHTSTFALQSSSPPTPTPLSALRQSARRSRERLKVTHSHCCSWDFTPL